MNAAVSAAAKEAAAAATATKLAAAELAAAEERAARQAAEMAEVERLRAEAERKAASLRAAREAVEAAEIERLRAEAEARDAAERAAAERRAARAAAEAEEREAAEQTSAPQITAASPSPGPAIGTAEADDLGPTGDGASQTTIEGARPAALTGPRGGTADDLKRIKGIGAKLEILCNQLGFYHFDQIAAWSDREVAWVDANLKGFKGRVTREKWVEQATILAAES
jgi:predicted flap endonuclease-1-like 5' DNA nuclease